jgi:hypothetical protein
MVGGAGLLIADVRLRSFLLREGRQRAITSVFGVPRGDQSALVTMLLLGAGAAVLRDLLPRPWPDDFRSDAAMGGSLVNATLRGLAGPPSQGMPVAGGLIAFAMVSHPLRPAAVRSVHEARTLAREAREALSARYWR